MPDKREELMSDGFKYASAVITVSNAQPGQAITIEIAPEASGETICWSTGNPRDESVSGITISATNGVPMPLRDLSINGTVIDLQTSGDMGHGVVGFNIDTCMTSNTRLQLFKIRSTSDVGPILTFRFAGRRPITLSQYYVILEWPPA
jgi:hypothetical protein